MVTCWEKPLVNARRASVNMAENLNIYLFEIRLLYDYSVQIYTLFIKSKTNKTKNVFQFVGKGIQFVDLRPQMLSIVNKWGG